ncbi:MAG: alcohol dehydrogenase catalytic domain-containing protein [Syntrophorhabdales bacterium]
MKGVVIKEGHAIELGTFPDPRTMDAGDAVLKVTAAAICGTDVHATHGLIPGVKPGNINGHEFVGIVEEVGAGVTKFKVGDRVSAPPAFWCGICPACARGDIQYCHNGGYYGGGETFGKGLQGAQATYLRTVYADNCLVPVPDNLSDEQAVLVGDVFSTGFHAAHEARIKEGDTVVIFGCGPIGIGALVSAWQFGPKEVICVDMLDNRLAMARQYGARTIDARNENAVERVREITGGEGADSAIEAIGNTDTFGQSLRSVRRGGTVSVVGLFPGPAEFPIHEFGFYGITVSMGLGYVGRTSRLMGLAAAGRVDLTPLVTHVFPLDKALEAYELFENHRGTCQKVVLKP